MDGYLDYSKII